MGKKNLFFVFIKNTFFYFYFINLFIFFNNKKMNINYSQIQIMYA